MIYNTRNGSNDTVESQKEKKDLSVLIIVLNTVSQS